MLISYLKHSISFWLAKISFKDETVAGAVWCFVFTAVLLLASEPSLAQETTAVDEVVCNIVEALQGNVARAVAAFGIIFLGFSLFLGKISWGVALALGIGIGAIFGAGDIVDIIAGDGADTCQGV